METGKRCAYLPQLGSTPWRVIEYFTTNPEEELTVGDIASKFDLSPKHVHTQLALAVESGALIRRMSDDDELAYRLGEGVPQIKPNRGLHPSLKGAGLANVIATRRASPAAMADLDLDSITPDDGIPVPEEKRLSATSALKHKLRALQPGQSIRLPIAVNRTIGPLMRQLSKAGDGEYTKRTLDADFVRVWRTK